jgi:hypothetical protein
MPSKLRDELIEETKGKEMTKDLTVRQDVNEQTSCPRPNLKSYRASIKYLAGTSDCDDVLKLSEDLFKELFDGNSIPRYVAIHSLRNSLPHLGWLLFSAELDRGLPPNTCAVTVTIRFSLPSTVLIRACSPCSLESAILTLPPHAYDELVAKSGTDILAKFESSDGRYPLLRQGEFRPELQCRVRLCEPVDQGKLTKDTRLTLVKEQSGEEEAPPNIMEQDIDVEISQFLDLDDLEISQEHKTELSLKVLPLASPPTPDFLNPAPEPLDDLETFALAKIESLAAIGCFSGDIVSDIKKRLLHYQLTR